MDLNVPVYVSSDCAQFNANSVVTSAIIQSSFKVQTFPAP